MIIIKFIVSIVFFNNEYGFYALRKSGNGTHIFNMIYNETTFLVNSNSFVSWLQSSAKYGTSGNKAD
ncbi:hypothetical protein DWW10_08480 [Bacteroides intestinalis]|uniref:Uncharacterized protein n=1 Tax=Bacteroides intestinalis TaxID=329854 RepID=A0A412YDN5_9BACE|nr:hypothetical protein DWW10_08480 [Bacteroides intestinalis]RHA60306.1 hypothetical protein DW932_09915 [Bacteroides intestinalis]